MSVFYEPLLIVVVCCMFDVCPVRAPCGNKFYSILFYSIPRSFIGTSFYSIGNIRYIPYASHFTPSKFSAVFPAMVDS